MAVYTLFGQPANPAAIVADTSGYTLGVQWSVTLTAGQTGTLTTTWFNSASGAGSLPSQMGLWTVSGPVLVASQAASWFGAAGSGWASAAWSSPPVLVSGTVYTLGVFDNAGTNWYSDTAGYWTTGPGSGGVTNGPLSAPNNAGASPGQDSFIVTGSLAFPNSSGNGANYWIDPEVTVTGGNVQQPIPADQMTASGGDLYAAVWGRGYISRRGWA